MLSIDEATVDALKAWSAIQAEDRLRWGLAYANKGEPGTGPLLTKENGEPIFVEALSARFKARIAKIDGLDQIRFHDLRHTAATLMLGAGVPVTTVAERLGHASPVITLSIYSHVLPGQGEAAAAALGRLLAGH